MCFFFFVCLYYVSRRNFRRMMIKVLRETESDVFKNDYSFIRTRRRLRRLCAMWWWANRVVFGAGEKEKKTHAAISQNRV